MLHLSAIFTDKSEVTIEFRKTLITHHLIHEKIPYMNNTNRIITILILRIKNAYPNKADHFISMQIRTVYSLVYNPVAIKLLVSGRLTGHIGCVYLCFYIITDFIYLYLISSVQVVCHFNILLTS